MQFGLFIKTKSYKLEGNKSLVKEKIGKSLIFIYCVGAPQKWSKSGSLHQNLHFLISTWILSKFSTFHWICLLFILLILVGVELPLRIVVILSWSAVTFSEVRLSIRSFCFIYNSE